MDVAKLQAWRERIARGTNWFALYPKFVEGPTRLNSTSQPPSNNDYHFAKVIFILLCLADWSFYKPCPNSVIISRGPAPTFSQTGGLQSYFPQGYKTARRVVSKVLVPWQILWQLNPALNEFQASRRLELAPTHVLSIYWNLLPIGFWRWRKLRWCSRVAIAWIM